MSNQTCNWLIIATTLALSIGSALAIDHAHDLGGHGAITLTLNNGTKWPTDAPLRQGMTSIKAALLPQLPAIHENRLQASQYLLLAKQTNTQIGFMVTNCKLSPDADAQLHLIIADLGGAAEAMAGNDQKMSRQGGALRLQHALKIYGEFFDHPDWSLSTSVHEH